MSIFVYLSALLAMANCAGMLYSGFGPWHVILFIVALIMAVLGIVMPGPEKADGRVISVLAIIMASLPLVRQPIRHLHYVLRERSYAKVVAPLAKEWKDARTTFSKGIVTWEKEYKVPPAFDGVNAIPPAPKTNPALPGIETATNPSVSLTLPNDPFGDLNEPCRYWTDARTQWVLVSKGPDKKFDIKVPPLMPPSGKADGRGRWLALNEHNFANLIYDPTNGSLGKGDLLWANGTAEATNAFSSALVGAWSRGMAAVDKAPTGKTMAETAGAAARTLLDQGDVLAAIAAGTLSATKIPKYRAQQRAPDFEGRLVQGEALYQLGDPRMAAAALAAYVELAPNDPRGHFHLAAALYYSGDIQEARREFAAASQIDEKSPLVQPAYDALMAITRNQPPTSIVPPGQALKK